ncbi:ricin B lectin domain protein [Rhodotorula toruloides]|uniref:Ricin B lectin domain protein n=1 Tax=Rhodotorula toruloides TaxID=5286 RepID=A0A511KI42_RHOTO|nr:ricin B lectin domain protein [Rhodotorula toruloides]
MHIFSFSFLALVLVVSGTTAKSTSKTAKHVLTCSPPKSDYLWNVLAHKNHNIGFRTSSASHVKLATRVTDRVNTHENMLWNVVPASKGVHRIETATGRCLISHGKNAVITLGSCNSPSAAVCPSHYLVAALSLRIHVTQWEISCTKCGKTACGDEFANECVVKSKTQEGHCIARVKGGLREFPCEAKSKVQLWDFVLA